MKELKKVDYRILAEFMKNSRLSDRQLAKNLEISQPTVTRRRTMLEKQKLLEYTAVPDLKKLGFEMLAITFANWKHEHEEHDERIDEAKAFCEKHPSILFVSTGRGLGTDRVAVSVHKNYSDYHNLMTELRQEWGGYLEKIDSFIVSLQKDTILMNFTFKCLAELIKKSGNDPRKARKQR